MENDGGTSGEAKTFTQVEMDAALAGAREEGTKAGRTEAHTHWQSVGDKAINQLTKEFDGRLGQANETITELRKAQLDTMTPEDRSAALMQQVLERIDGKGANDASTKSSPFDQSVDSQRDKPSAQDQQAAELAQQRKTMGDNLAAKFGIDASKLDWAEGKDGTAAMDVFMESFAGLVKEAGNTEKPKEDPNKVDTANQPGGSVFDLNTADPKDLIRAGAGRVRSGMNDSDSVAPWL